MDTNDKTTTADVLPIVEKAYMDISIKFTEAGISPMASAAVMAKLALMLYKSSLTEEEYNEMIDTISESRDSILTLEDYAAVTSARLN